MIMKQKMENIYKKTKLSIGITTSSHSIDVYG